MKLKSSLKSAKASILAAMTIASAIATYAAPSLAALPTWIVSTPGKPDLAVYRGNITQGFALGCPALRNLWSGIRTENTTDHNAYNKLANFEGSSLRYLDCNAPGLVQGYTSPAFGSNAGVIIARGYPHYIKSAQFFTAMGIRPINLTEQEAKSFIIQHSRGLSTNVVLETQIAPIAPPQTPAAPPVVIPTRNMTVTFINRGAYIAKYTVEYNLFGIQKVLNTGNI